ncbi:MAG TPA: hypothetical protein VK196_13215 [Magnetospirillum sp.]|nr:hypothetical protein [Magnetospirillum sp.]
MADLEEGFDYDFELSTAVSAFELTGNAMFAWFALKRALTNKFPIPSQISEYFIWVTNKLLELNETQETAKPVRDAVFGIPTNGRGSPFSDFHRDWPRILFTYEVLMDLKGKHRGRRGTDASFAVEVIGDYQVDGLQSEDTQVAAFERIGEKYGFIVEQAEEYFGVWRAFWEGEKVKNLSV